MIETGAREDLHAWLVSTGHVRRHALAIRAYGAWRTFMRIDSRSPAC